MATLAPHASAPTAKAPNAALTDCPARLAVEIIADKWSFLVIFALRTSPRRHGELVDAVGGISRKVLTQSLRKLQGYGLVHRTQAQEYALTDPGATLVEPIEMLNRWAYDHGEAIVEFQESHRVD